MEAGSWTWIGGVLVLVVGVAGGYGLLRRRQLQHRLVRRRLVREVSQGLSLPHQSFGLFGRPATAETGAGSALMNLPGQVQLGQEWERAEGQLEGLPVELVGIEREGRSLIEVVVRLTDRLPAELACTQQAFEHTLARMSGKKVQDVLTGDPGFDDRMVLRGSQAHLVRAWMDHGVRRAVIALAVRCRQLALLPDRALLIFEDKAENPLQPELVLRSVRELLQLVRLFVGGPSPMERLIRVVQEDPEPAVRRRSVESLARRYASEPMAQEALRGALQDEDWLVRLAAAKSLGGEALETFAHMLHVAPRPWPEFVVTAVAELNNPLFLSLLRSALPTSIPAVLAIGRMQDREAIPRLLKAYDQVDSTEHRQAILEVLELLGALEAQPLLIREIQNPDTPASLRQTAVQALGSCGDLRALEVLSPLTRVMVGSSLRSLSQQAMAAIEARQGQGEPEWHAQQERHRMPVPQKPDTLALMADEQAERLGAAPREPVRPVPPSLTAAAWATQDVLPTATPEAAPVLSWQAPVPPEQLSAQPSASPAEQDPFARELQALVDALPETPLEAGVRPRARGERAGSDTNRKSLDVQRALSWLDDGPLTPPSGRGRGPQS